MVPNRKIGRCSRPRAAVRAASWAGSGQSTARPRWRRSPERRKPRPWATRSQGGDKGASSPLISRSSGVCGRASARPRLWGPGPSCYAGLPAHISEGNSLVFTSTQQVQERLSFENIVPEIHTGGWCVPAAWVWDSSAHPGVWLKLVREAHANREEKPDFICSLPPQISGASRRGFPAGAGLPGGCWGQGCGSCAPHSLHTLSRASTQLLPGPRFFLRIP